MKISIAKLIRFWDNLVGYSVVSFRPLSGSIDWRQNRESRVTVRSQKTEEMRYNNERTEASNAEVSSIRKKDDGRTHRSSIEIVTLKRSLVRGRGDLRSRIDKATVKLWSVPPRCECVPSSFRLAAFSGHNGDLGISDPVRHCYPRCIMCHAWCSETSDSTCIRRSITLPLSNAFKKNCLISF